MAARPSSFIFDSETPESSRVGASFIATMVVPSVTALLLSLYLVVPPLVPAVFRSTVASAAGAVEDESTRRTVRAPGMPFQLGTGLNFRL